MRLNSISTTMRGIFCMNSRKSVARDERVRIALGTLRLLSIAERLLRQTGWLLNERGREEFALTTVTPQPSCAGISLHVEDYPFCGQHVPVICG